MTVIKDVEETVSVKTQMTTKVRFWRKVPVEGTTNVVNRSAASHTPITGSYPNILFLIHRSRTGSFPESMQLSWRWTQKRVWKWYGMR